MPHVLFLFSLFGLFFVQFSLEKPDETHLSMQDSDRLVRRLLLAARFVRERGVPERGLCSWSDGTLLVSSCLDHVCAQETSLDCALWRETGDGEIRAYAEGEMLCCTVELSRASRLRGAFAPLFVVFDEEEREGIVKLCVRRAYASF